ncbi:MAG: site-specific integrase [Steroidobacteraceae bacterium]
MIDPSRVRVTGPLAPFATGFVAELQRQGYTPGSAVHQLRLMDRLGRWLAEEGLDPGRLSPIEAERFLEACRAAGHRLHISPRGLAPLLAYLRGLGAVPAPSPAPAPAGEVEDLLARFRRYLITERGVEERTARDYSDGVRPFLNERASSMGLDLAELNAADVNAFALTRCTRQSTGVAKKTVVALRSLLRFLHLQGVIPRSLAPAVPSVAGWRLAGLPRGLEPTQVRSLLDSCDRDTAKGRRDFAIVTMLVRLGLRAGEVAALKLDDIHWRSGEIVVRGKGRRSERLPLPVDVGETIAAYLRDGRPDSAQGRSVFIRLLAPHGALSRGGVTNVVASAAQRAGLEGVYAHRLRHTAATEMLRGGASLSEVGQLLRHRHAQTTAIYAKVDREALRALARPWPGGAA